MNKYQLAWIGIVGLLLGGCVKLNVSQTTPESKFYILQSTLTPAQTPETPVAVVELKTLTLPAYLEQPLITIRRQPNQIESSEFERWAERLSKGIRRVLVENLNALAPAYAVRTTHLNIADTLTYELHLYIYDFIADLKARAVILNVQWLLTTNDRGSIIDQGTFNQAIPLSSAKPSYPQIVSTMDDALKTLSQSLAQILDKMPVNGVKSDESSK